MKRYIVAGLYLSIILFPLFCYTYVKGMADGVARYKTSKNFYMTLYSMYRYGVIDGYAACGGKK